MFSARAGTSAGDLGSGWPGAESSQVGRQRSSTAARCYVHPESPATGDYWMKQSAISFYRLKLTNNANDQRGNVRSEIFVLLSLKSENFQLQCRCTELRLD